MLRIFVDGDACPVKNEIYRVAERDCLRVTVQKRDRSRFLQSLDAPIQRVHRQPRDGA